MQKFPEVISAYNDILQKIETYKTKKSVELIAISKYHSPEKIRALYEYGHRVFGENYLNELMQKNQSK